MQESKSSYALMIHQGKMVMQLRDNNPNISNPNKWGVIGGQAEDGETPDETLLREVFEETCVHISKWQKLFEKDGRTAYHVPLTEDEAASVKLGNEGQRVDFFSYEELVALPLADGLLDIFEQNKPLLQKLLQS